MEVTPRKTREVGALFALSKRVDLHPRGRILKVSGFPTLDR